MTVDIFIIRIHENVPKDSATLTELFGLDLRGASGAIFRAALKVAKPVMDHDKNYDPWWVWRIDTDFLLKMYAELNVEKEETKYFSFLASNRLDEDGIWLMVVT